MLTIFGGSQHTGRRLCDGLSRRSFLKIGGMALGGLSLAQLLECEAAAGVGRNHKALINVFLPGGPPHLDMWDIKEDAPSDIRGEFRAIETNVPGIRICEMFPRIAKMMDKFVPVRSLVGSTADHDGYQCMTGRLPRPAPPGDWPALGAVVAKLEGRVNPVVPPHVSLFYPTKHRQWGEPGTGGFLGQAYSPFRLLGSEPGAASQDMVLRGITLEQLRDREKLLASLDRFRRTADDHAGIERMDAHAQQAFAILTSSKLVDALDLSQEDPRVLERYGKNDQAFQRDGAPRMVENFCIARRLVEAGARVVSLNFSRWDWHGPDGKNFVEGRIDMPLLDQALSALVTDLHERGLDRDVSVVCWGEFGRTPRLNQHASRDHWPNVSCAMLAGGGMKTGQVIGSTDRIGAEANSRPVTHQDIFATLYHNLGIDPHKTTIQDLSGRPVYLVDSEAEPIRELVS